MRLMYIQSNYNSSSKKSMYISIIMTLYNSENCFRNELKDSKTFFFGFLLNSANTVLAISSMMHYNNYIELCCQQS